MRVFLDPAMLKAELPQLVLRPGMTLAARVAERQGSRGLLMIANAALVAELPDQVKAGDTLRLRVQETSAERVVMKLEPSDAAPVQQQPVAVPVPLPGGLQAHLLVDEREGSQVAGRRSQVAVTYGSPSLGDLDFHLAVEGGTITAHVRAREGAPYELAAAQAEKLRDALNRATGKAVQLAVSPRHDPFDTYA